MTRFNLDHLQEYHCYFLTETYLLTLNNQKQDASPQGKTQSQVAPVCMRQMWL